jgi:hypothetical protein
MARSAAIGGACRLELGFERYRFPGFTVPEGETAFSYLYQLAHDGLLRRYRPVTKQALKQLAHELDVIERTNLAEFFLIVWDLMEFARQRKIIGQGRGSAGDSIVAYCLGITKVDPIEHKLLFERFINEARALPDIDIDFDVNRREEVIQYLTTSTAPTTPPWSARSSRTAPATPCARWRRRSASRPRGSTGSRRRSTPARPATWRATWRSTAASPGCSPSSGSTWPPPRSRRAAMGEPIRPRPQGLRLVVEPPAPADPRSAADRPGPLGAAAQAAGARRIGHVGAPRV